jgi:NADPH-dependent ferric siderophore reductase
MTDAAATASEASTVFHRERHRHRFTAREATVVAVSHPAPEYVRVTLTGPDFADFGSTGPGDHTRTFFPDPATGELVAPVATGPGEEGVVRPDRVTFGRDFTPLNVRDEAGRRLVDLDILRHENAGPAAQWAARAAIGDRLVLVGPRGSKAATQNASRVVLVVDGTSLPAAARWLAEGPASTAVEVIAAVPDPDTAREYLAQAVDRGFALHAAGGDLVTALTAVGVDASTYVFAAGEASALVPLRRHLRHTLMLPREQYSVTGYWRGGVEAWDHHAPIDPIDPD